LSYISPQRLLHSFPTRRSSDLGIHWLKKKIHRPSPEREDDSQGCFVFARIRFSGGRLLEVSNRQKRRARSGASHPPSDHRLHKRSEEHTSELQSRSDLVCRLLL